MSDALIFGSLDYALAHGLLSALVVTATHLWCRSPSTPAAQRAALWFAALCVCALAPLFALAWQMAVPAALDAGPALASSIDALPASIADTGEGGLPLDGDWARLLLAAWWIGAALALARLVFGHRQLRRQLAAAPRSPALEAAHRDLLPDGVEIRLSDATGPLVAGLRQPVIVLPASLADALSANALRSVLTHEATHVRRHDPLMQTLQRLVEAMFWWNPLMRLAGASLDSAREVACDAQAARAFGSGVDYAEGLLDAVARIVPAKAPCRTVALGMHSSVALLHERIAYVIEPRPATRPAIRWMLAVVLLALASTGWMAALAAPRLIATRADASPGMAETTVQARWFREGSLREGALQEGFAQENQAQEKKWQQMTEAYESALIQANERHERELMAANERFESALAQAQEQYERERDVAQRRIESERDAIASR